MIVGVRRLGATLLAALPAACAWATGPSAAQLDAVQSLRFSDPPSFVAAVRTLEDATPPADVALRDQLRYLGAQALALESRRSCGFAPPRWR